MCVKALNIVCLYKTVVKTVGQVWYTAFSQKLRLGQSTFYRGTKYTCPIADCSVKVACELGNTLSTVGADNMHVQIRNVASHLNDFVHEQAKKMITFYQNEPQRYKTFDVG